MTTDLTYKINNGEEQTINTEDFKLKTIVDFFNIKLQNNDEKIFMINAKVIDEKTKILKILSDCTNSVINIYTPQNFRFEAKEKKILFKENLMIPDLKRKLRHEFNIKEHKIKIVVDNDDQLTDILNDEKRSFYKYIKPDLTFLIEINKKSTNNDDNNNETNSDEKAHSKALDRNDKLSKRSYKKNPEILNPKKISKSKSIRQKSVEIFRNPIKIKSFKANYQINKGEIQNIAFTEEKGNTLYEIFSDLLPQFDEKKLIFVLIDNDNQYILLDSQKEISFIFPTDSIISIFTPITFSYRKNNFEFPFQFNSTIGDLKTAIKEHLQIKRAKNIFFSVRTDKNKNQKDLDSIFNNDRKHIIKFIKPDMTIDIIPDEFRFILVDEVFEYKDGKNERRVMVQLSSTAADFIEKYKIKNDLQKQNGLIYCLRFNKVQYILPNTILSTFKSEYGDEECLKIQIVSHNINKIIINKTKYNYAFCKSKTTIEEAKEIIFYNYFFGKRTVNLDDIYLSISGITFANNEDEIKLYHEKTLLLQIGYQFNNYKDQIFYFSLETTVKQAKEKHNWTYLKNINTREKIDDSLNLFSCCYRCKIDAITEIKLYLDINGYEISIVLPDNTKFSKIRELIEKDQKIIEKLNKIQEDSVKSKKRKEQNYSNDFIFLFNDKEIPDDSTVESFQTAKNNPIFIVIKQKYQDLLFFENTTKDINPFIDDEEGKFYKTVKIIGEGSTSTVYKIIDTRTGEILCKKVLKITDESSQFTNAKNAIKEFEVLYSIKHPCICKAIKINMAEPIIDDDEKTTISLYLEFLSHSLKECIEKDILDNTLKVRIVIEIVHAMKFIHKHGMIHRDLKVENIMLNSIFESKIVDFGLVGIDEYISGKSFVHSTKTKGIGTLPYMSPEMINEENYDLKTDVYSFGMVLHYLFLKKLPTYTMKDKINGIPIPLSKPSSSITQFGIDLISNCTNYKPSDRPSFDDILNDIKENSFLIAPEIDESLILRRDIELSFFESTQT